MGPMRHFVFFDHLDHLQPGDLHSVEAGDHLGKVFVRLPCERRHALFHRFPHGCSQRRTTGIGRQRTHMILHFGAELWCREIVLAGQQQPREPIARVQDVPGRFAEGHDFRRGPEIEVIFRKIFHCNGSVLANSFPRVENMLGSNHDHIVPAPEGTGENPSWV